ncbi:MAG: copper resistance system multicopper oxidase [Parvularculaceae bacterium]
MSPFTRRQFLTRSVLAGGAVLAPNFLAPWARANGMAALTGTEFDLTVSRLTASVGGKAAPATLVNGTLPGPLLRWREGDDITLRVTNLLDEDTSIHWHGILLPAAMDGVPGVSFSGIRPGETFVYRFPVKQAGTYWYHSHSGLQEQSGHYGPIIIDPKDADPVAYEREHVIVLSDWTYRDPQHIFSTLKKSSETYNYQRRTLGDFFRDAKKDGVGAALSERAMWGRMRMDPADIADVTGAAYTYLVNGHAPDDNWTGLFGDGERVRLRIINASAMTIFNFRIPDLAMTVVQADGQNVRPVETDEIQIGVAETYDVIVRPSAERPYTMMAETIDRSGFAAGTLAPRHGMRAPVPAPRPRPTLTMKDMAMSHGAGHGDMSGMDHGGMDHGSMQHDAMDHGSMKMSGMEHDAQAGPIAHHHPTGVGVDMIAEAPSNRLGDRGLGLEDAPHRVLVYTDLRSLKPDHKTRMPEREIELHLTGNMERYMWSFDGVKFSDVDAPIAMREGERVRLTLVNDTMMNHPIHLHGMFFELVNGAHHDKPRKHTIIVKPGDKLSVDLTADAPGEWAFHCHLLYHMVAGMMQTVMVSSSDAPAPQMHPAQHSGHGDHQ